MAPKNVIKGSRPSGSSRLAPLGSPVVPDVKMMTWPDRLGFLGAAAVAAPAYADNNVLCVQQELAGRGYNPGPIDGALGSRTQSAAQSAAAAGRLGLPPLTAGTAGAWCQALRGPGVVTFSAVQPFTVPSTAPNRSGASRKYSLGMDESCPPNTDVYCTE